MENLFKVSTVPLSVGALCSASLLALSGNVHAQTKEKLNIIVVLADDISAREFPGYGSSVWSAPREKFYQENSNPAYRAQTPMLDRLAKEGAVIRTAWANAVCSPSRATLMTGRYAHLHKWWQNSDIGTYRTADGKVRPWPLYMSSHHTIGQVAKEGGYATFWVGKTQMKASDLSRFEFDSVITSPGIDLGKSGTNPHTDFKLLKNKEPGPNKYISEDTGEPCTADWPEQSFFWQPNFGTLNWPEGTHSLEWWPNTPESGAKFGLATYGPDVEMDFILKFMEKKHAEGKPFFIYHTSHLGHEARNWLGQPGKIWYPGTPKIQWDGEKYLRTEPEITGDRGVYDTHGTVTDPGIHHHVNYLDYQVWQYMTELEKLGIKDKTVFIFTVDNGTLGYGKMQVDRERGPRVPFYIYIPGMKKHGMQEILTDVTDILPTIAEVAGVQLPDDYEINGKSLVPYLTTDQTTHRDWIYSFLFEKQLIRGYKVLRDGNGDWWDVENEPADMDSYPKITNWEKVSPAHRKEKKMLEEILPRFDKHDSEHDAPAALNP
ncbi:MAG: sulfatase-like hydrolase/transferase [Kiritimatiellales bacterium]